MNYPSIQDEPSFSDYAALPNSIYRQPSILGQDCTDTSVFQLQEYESDHHASRATNYIQNANEAFQEPRTHIPTLSTLESINTTSRLQRQKHGHQRTLSLGNQYTIREQVNHYPGILYIGLL